jgi:hypothetical protein
LGSAGSAWPAVVRVDLFGGERVGLERHLGGCDLAIDSGVVPGVLERRTGSLAALDGGPGGRWRARITDPASGDELAVLGLDRPLEAEFQPFRGERLKLGALATRETPALRAGLAVPDERAPLVIGVAVLLLAAAALMGRWRAS